MRSEPLMATAPPAPVRSIGELYAIALMQAEKARLRYGKLAADRGEAFKPVQCVFEVLAQREDDRIRAVREACLAAIDRKPEQPDSRWRWADLVPTEELSDVENSLLFTPYRAWALAVRHRARAFMFWTYVAALAANSTVRKAAEDMAREALRDGNLLRRERRLAWRSETRKSKADNASETSEISSAALLESLLLKDLFRWAQVAPSSQRGNLLSLIGVDPTASMALEVVLPDPDTLEKSKSRALRRAEQLSSIYLEKADNAIDQTRLELAQQLAARSIARLADLRAIASSPQSEPAS
jgi:hypothetical protein